MPGNLTSAEATSGTDALASQYNSLRDDVLVNAGDYADSTGSANAYVLAVSSDLPVYAAGQVFKFKANFANTGAATIAVNGQAAKTIKKNHDVDLEANDIEIGSIVKVMYDGTDMQLLSPTAIDISSANKAVLTGGVTSDASQLHKHKKTSISGSRDLAAASGAVTYAHGLSQIPRYVRITGQSLTGASATGVTSSFGTFDGSNTKSICVFYAGARAGDTSEESTVFIIKLASSNTAYQTAVITVDATNITLTWTKTSTPTYTGYFIIESEA